MEQWREADQIEQWLQPFWDTGRIEGETLLFTKGNTADTPVRLAFLPDAVLKVTDSHGGRCFAEGRDWVCKGQDFYRLPGSEIPELPDDLVSAEKRPDHKCFPRLSGGWHFFTEGHYIHDHQIRVTYTSRSIPENWGRAALTSGTLPRTCRLLQARGPLNLLLTGDSISVGANASGITGAPPWQPSWGKLVSLGLEKQYGIPVRFTNHSKGGVTSAWGVEHLAEALVAMVPDTVMIAYGMNDGTARLSPEDFVRNIRMMISKVRERNPLAEFVLVKSMSPHPEPSLPDQPALGFQGTQEDCANALDALAGEGTGIADVQKAHAWLLKNKRYIDLTGNNVNHPNDFLIRIYAHIILGLFQ